MSTLRATTPTPLFWSFASRAGLFCGKFFPPRGLSTPVSAKLPWMEPYLAAASLRIPVSCLPPLPPLSPPPRPPAAPAARLTRARPPALATHTPRAPVGCTGRLAVRWLACSAPPVRPAGRPDRTARTARRSSDRRGGIGGPEDRRSEGGRPRPAAAGRQDGHGRQRRQRGICPAAIRARFLPEGYRLAIENGHLQTKSMHPHHISRASRTIFGNISGLGCLFWKWSRCHFGMKSQI